MLQRSLHMIQRVFRQGGGLVVIALLVVGGWGFPLAAQQPPIPRGENAEIFQPLDMPTPNQYRTASGRPGPQYWQQEVDYTIDARLHPASHTLQGEVAIHYTNNSPDTLQYLWLQLDQNLFRPDSRGAQIIKPGQRFQGVFPEGGFQISDVQVRQSGTTHHLEYLIDRTLMRVSLPRPLPAQGGSVTLTMTYRFQIPSSGADRMGRMDVERGIIYQMAQWYPRMFVYDDMHGWNVMPYLGQGEFYLEYGEFEVDLTVPRDFVVLATGQLQNPEEVLTTSQQQRLQKARQSSQTVSIIAPSEVGQPDSRPRGEGALTWKFHADSVRDFSWAASQAFIWDAASWEGVLAMSAYPHEGLGDDHQPGWERSTRYVRHALKHYSQTWARYPYPVAINVAGPVMGMEYPMIVFCSVHARGEGLFHLTDHEIGHSWFPMLVGSDERRWLWMDEGLTTFLGYYSTHDFYDAREPVLNRGETARLQLGMRSNTEFPIMTYTDRMDDVSFGYLGYHKPAMGLVLLREYVLGPDRFDDALKAYINRWSYKHPKPADFFRTIENVAGADLDWFWQGWFNHTYTLDQAIQSVRTKGTSTQVVLTHNQGLLMPARLQIRYRDGRTETRSIPVQAWYRSDRFRLRIQGGEVQSLHLDPDGQLPDINRENNDWEYSSPAQADSASSQGAPSD